MKNPAKKFSLRRSSLMGFVLITGVSATLPSSGNSTGYSVSGSATGCRSCHTGTSYPTLEYFGAPSFIEVGTSDAMYIRIQRGSTSLTECGFNAWASSGSLSPTTGLYGTGVRAINGDEVTHSGPQGVASGYCRFGFDFDAPSTTGNVTITTWGNTVNANNNIDSTDSAASRTLTIPVCRDWDGDGNWSGPSGCPGTSDCNDFNANRYYGNSETCDGQDNDCDGSIDEGVRTTYYRDLDGDGYGNAGSTTQACSAPAGYVSNSGDCDDTDGDNHPFNAETCDGQDNDCDSLVDEGVLTTYYRDLDGDGQGRSSATTAACSQPTGYVSNSNDCNDFCGTCYLGGTEVCDGLDNDCDGTTDEASATDADTWYRDFDGDGYGNAANSTTACSQPTGYVANATDCADADSARYPGRVEWCDNKDNDCSGATPVDVGCDDDNDDHCDAGMTTVGTPSTCLSGSADCDDSDSARHPGQVELCDNKDNDCNGATAVDVGCDDDNDNYCDSAMTLVGSSSTCPNGGGDCDDTCITCYPGRAEACDGEDNDCNGLPDDDIQSLTCGTGVCEAVAAGCVDGEPQSCTPGTPRTESCANPGTDDDCDGDLLEISHAAGGAPIYVGSSGCSSGLPGICGPGTYECDGTTLSCTAVISPGDQVEICDDLDNDCDGAVDEGCDDDNDDYCDEDMTVVGTPTTCSLGGGDCNDAPSGGAAVNPGAAETCSNLNVDNDCDGDDRELQDGVYGTDDCVSANPGVCAPGHPTCVGSTLTCASTIAPGSLSEVCDSLDNDCDGATDERPPLTCGVGACSNTAPACSGGFDNVCTPLPSSSEICDDVDNDCDGAVDEGCDDDNDDYCDAAMTVTGSPTTCSQGGGDCDDDSVATYPGAGEQCDSLDNDCDGEADEPEDIALAQCGQGICASEGTTCEQSSCTPGLPETEICDDLDNDCDGDVDEGCDDDDDGYCDDRIATEGTPSVCPNGGGDCDDTSPQDNPGSAEVCDTRDNDCDGQADEVSDVPLATCGVGFCARVGTTCDPASCQPGTPLPEICDGIDNDCNGLPDDGLPLATCGEGACFTQGTSCLPSSCLPLEPSEEIWDAVDNDCDGQIDEGADDDNDGYCDFSATHVSSPFCPLGGGDCNDDNADTHPGAQELCDGEDNNCEPCAENEDCSQYVDNDIEVFYCGSGECRSEGTSCNDGETLECVAADPEVEMCDGLDNDCDGVIDNGISDRVCGVGECMVVVPGCADEDLPSCEELVRSPTDEVCDGLDNDCDGQADEDRESLCEGGLCVAGQCISDEDLDSAGIDRSNIPDDIDGELLLEITEGAAQGGRSSLPDADANAGGEGGFASDSVSDRGACSYGAPHRRAPSPVPGLLILTMMAWWIRSRQRRSGEAA